VAKAGVDGGGQGAETRVSRRREKKAFAKKKGRGKREKTTGKNQNKKNRS
jgi:hypothetical protein